MKLSNFFIVIFTLLFSNCACAIPNVWTNEFGQGWRDYSIYNKNYWLSIGCNSAVDETTDHFLSFTSIKNKKNHIDLFTKPNHVLAFLIDGQAFDFGTHESGHVETSYRNAANHWRDFIEALQKARSIKVYYDDKQMVEFRPQNANSAVLEYMPEDCAPISYKRSF